MPPVKMEAASVAAGLMRSPLFDGLAVEDDLRRCCPTASTERYQDKDAIYSQGQACPYLFCVLDGQIKLARVSSDGGSFTTALLAGGGVFGPALSGFADFEAQDTATARGAALLWQTPAAEFARLLSRQPQLGLRLIEMLGRRQRQLERRLACLALKRTEARLAETLSELSGNFETRCEHGFGQHLRITQQELADLVGASRPVVSGILNRLRRQGVLGYSREYLCVRDLEEIQRLVGE